MISQLIHVNPYKLPIDGLAQGGQGVITEICTTALAVERVYIWTQCPTDIGLY